MCRRIISKVVGLVLGESVPHRHKSITKTMRQRSFSSALHNEIRWREAEAQSVRKQNCHVCCVSHLQQQVLANRSYTVPSTIRATQYPNCHKTPRHPPPPHLHFRASSLNFMPVSTRPRIARNSLPTNWSKKAIWLAASIQSLFTRFVHHFWLDAWWNNLRPSPLFQGRAFLLGYYHFFTRACSF